MKYAENMKSPIRNIMCLPVRIRIMLTNVCNFYIRMRLMCQRLSALYVTIRRLWECCNILYTGIMFRLAKHVTITHENTRLIAKCIFGFYLALKLIIRTIVLLYVWISLVYNFANAWYERIHFILSVARTQHIRLRHFFRGTSIFIKKARIILKSFIGFYVKMKRFIRSVLAVYGKILFTLRYVSLFLVPTFLVSERIVTFYRNIRYIYLRVCMIFSRNIRIIGLIWVLYLPTSIVLEYVYNLYVKTGTLLEARMRPDLQI